MNNLLHGEYYKLRKSRSFFVCLLILIVMSCISVGMFKVMQVVYTDEVKQSLNQFGMQSKEAGGNMSSLFEIDSMDGRTVLNQIFNGNTLQIVEAIFLALFVVSEYTTGAIKNIVTRGYSRTKAYGAKYIITIVAAEVMAIIMVVVSILAAMICWGTGFFTMDFVKELIPFIGVQLIVNLGVAGVIIMIATVSRNIAVSIAGGIVSIAFLPLILNGIDMILKDKFSVSELWIMNQVMDCSTFDLTNKIVTKGIGISIIYVIATFVIGAIYSQKADVK